MDGVEYRYFLWLCDKVGYDRKAMSDQNGYAYLLMAMFERTFYCTVARDHNRALDGERLRGEYRQETEDYDKMELGECRVLEMLIALAQRIEQQIMYSKTYGDRMPEWFWLMCRNLGLTRYDNLRWNERAVNRLISKWLDREYKENGVGGLFPMDSTEEIDQRNLEIWRQMQWYFAERYAV